MRRRAAMRYDCTVDGPPDGPEASGAGEPLPTSLPAWSVVVVRGRSMHPTLRDGDRLLVRGGPAAARGARPGDVVVVRLPGARPLSVKRLSRREANGGWWVERDNGFEGVDSWLVGALGPDALLGVVRARLWPRPGRPPGPPHRATGRDHG